MPRAVFPGVAHHLTQRGVDRQAVFFADRDRQVYLQLVQRAATQFGDDAHLWAALRYVERNPVRAGLRAAAEDWTWSSAAVHVGRQAAPRWLDLAPWRSRFTPGAWIDYLGAETFAEAEAALRINTYSGRPLGTEAFVERLEAAVGRKLRRGKGGRPKRDSAKVIAAGNGQGVLFTEE